MEPHEADLGVSSGISFSCFSNNISLHYFWGTSLISYVHVILGCCIMFPEKHVLTYLKIETFEVEVQRDQIPSMAMVTNNALLVHEKDGKRGLVRPQ
jgi:hypothetical protein